MLRNRDVRRPFTALAAGMALLALCTALGAPVAAFGERQAEGGVVVNATNAGLSGTGAGTVVGVSGSTVSVLTAKHVATFGALSVRFDDGTTAAGHIASIVPDRDLAIVAVDVDAAYAANLHVVNVARPARNAQVHVWGSGLNGPSFEPASVGNVGAKLPDGEVHDRYAIDCELCHQGDSGAGVFNERGELVGVYVGFFKDGDGRVSVAELPLDSATLAATLGNKNTVASAAPASMVAAVFTAK